MNLSIFTKNELIGCELEGVRVEPDCEKVVNSVVYPNLQPRTVDETQGFMRLGDEVKDSGLRRLEPVPQEGSKAGNRRRVEFLLNKKITHQHQCR